MESLLLVIALMFQFIYFCTLSPQQQCDQSELEATNVRSFRLSVPLGFLWFGARQPVMMLCSFHREKDCETSVSQSVNVELK